MTLENTLKTLKLSDPGDENVDEFKIKLYVDTLNYCQDFFKISSTNSVDWEQDLKLAKKKVLKFISAARKSNIYLEGFIDKSMSTQETVNKWKKRRERELVTGKCIKIANISILVGELFKQGGVRVHYSTIDNDDTIAAFAHHYVGDVLSRDTDFFRYRSNSSETPFKIYFSYHITRDGYLHLNPHHGPGRRGRDTSPRQIIFPLPQTKENTQFFFTPMPCEIEQNPQVYKSMPAMLKRGNITCLLQEFPNPHLTARPLRQALYCRIGQESVRECICTWNMDKKEGEWLEENVVADDTLDHLLDDHNGAVENLFGHEKRPSHCTNVAWNNHLFAQKTVVAEISAWATEKCILDIM